MPSQETINTARTLAQRLLAAQATYDDLNMRVNNPICGKPGKGFKAMRKLRPALHTAHLDLLAIETEVRVFLAPPKTNYQRREARKVLWDQIITELSSVTATREITVMGVPSTLTVYAACN